MGMTTYSGNKGRAKVVLVMLLLSHASRATIEDWYVKTTTKRAALAAEGVLEPTEAVESPGFRLTARK